MQSPILYHSNVEQIQDDEKQTHHDLEQALLQIMMTTSQNYGHAVRSVHAKSHGVIEAELEILQNLPPELAQGIFATAGRHQAIIRISTNPGDLLADSISVPRGLALKVLDVEGTRLSGAQGSTQDFIFVNGPVFSAPNAAAFAKNLQLLAKTTDKAEWAKKALSAVLQGAEKTLEAVGGESSTLQTLGGAPNVHPLGETYYTQTAYRYGDYVAKLSLVPVTETLEKHTGEKINTRGRRDALREEVAEDMQSGPATWDLRVQLCRDLEKMPVEDPSVLWDEELSPFVTVARLHADPQVGWSAERAKIADDHMRFSVWTGLEAHRPLGSVNRARRSTYALSSAYRADFNRCPIHEPAKIDLP
ncbi:catalase family protein [Falsirhodobacter sp. 20TX0035]|uniref:catalase family protein n=1 Tax=Falsirhodobacter sp. 20TX0035 TaxID=3022019 RepID=UPI00232F0568|nr:catalase family protein [Falsirhodobacter sp. 20TX0035]MDB6454479.1 catalase family protein [Falsirhodobacter sp. 20TX0035]